MRAAGRGRLGVIVDESTALGLPTSAPSHKESRSLDVGGFLSFHHEPLRGGEDQSQCALAVLGTGQAGCLLDQSLVDSRIAGDEELLHLVGCAVAAIVLPLLCHPEADDDHILVSLRAHSGAVDVPDVVHVQVDEAGPERPLGHGREVRVLDDDVREAGRRLGVRHGVAEAEVDCECCDDGC